MLPSSYKPRAINPMPPKGASIAVAMSGGVDSSVAALLLAQAGYKLQGFTAWTLDGPGKCCNDALINAGRVCDTLGIPYDTVDLRDTFKHFVKDHYHSAYLAGLTPNPCVECNRHVKWEPLIAYARETWGVDYVATGHYAQLQPTAYTTEDPWVKVYRGIDPRKDQTYMMSRVYRQDLQHTVFPLGGMVKPDVVALAKAHDLPTAHSKESMDVCFVLDGQANYLTGQLGKRPGPIVDVDTGNVVGQHNGYYLFTLGQRKGVQVAAGRPVYVVRIAPETNTIFIGDAHHLDTETFVAQSVYWLHPPQSTLVRVKIRYNSPSVLAHIAPVNTPTPNAAINWHQEQDFTVTLLEPQRAVTNGQIAGFYDETDTQLLGGGYIGQFLPHTLLPASMTGVQPAEACPITNVT
jgi:tRNA-uridine 2-sulfurtransferase